MARRVAAVILSAVLTVFALSGCNNTGEMPEIADDEILLLIQLDIKEDIGLLVVDYESDGSGGSGGTSNADKSLLKHGELLYYSLEKRSFDNPPDIMDLSLQFRVITEYIDPNYDNVYPEEYTVMLSAIRFDAGFGESYRITITGDKTNGYTAVLND